jgi:tryptophan synthase alpha chain
MASIRKTIEKRKSLIAFITAGDPNFEWSFRYIKAIADGGADVVELGVPFSDPMADGTVIQSSYRRALISNVRLPEILAFVKEVKKSINIPVVLMSYCNPIFTIGLEEFFSKAEKSGLDGLLIVDIPVEEIEEVSMLSKEHEIENIMLAALNTPEDRLKEISEYSTGFIYLVSTYGTTGSSPSALVGSKIREIKKTIGHTPVCVGFGITERRDVRKMIMSGADGVVAGSILVRIIEKYGESAAPVLRRKVRSLKEGTENFKYSKEVGVDDYDI